MNKIEWVLGALIVLMLLGLVLMIVAGLAMMIASGDYTTEQVNDPPDCHIEMRFVPYPRIGKPGIELRLMPQTICY